MQSSKLNTAELSDKELLSLCYASAPVWLKSAFPNDFPLPFADAVHTPIFEILDDRESKRNVIVAARGSGKTTIEIDDIARDICFRNWQFIVYISSNQQMAIRQTEGLKNILTTNPFIKKYFAPAKSVVFSKEWWIIEMLDGWQCLVLPLGWGQKVRGLNFRLCDGNTTRPVRPQRIILDDVEDDEEMKNADLRAQNVEWFFSKIAKTVDTSRSWRIDNIGTLVHEDCMVWSLMNDPRWRGVQLSMCDPNSLKSHWPEKISDAELLAEYEEHKRRNILDIFFREICSMPASGKGRFQQEMFKYYDESDISPGSVENIVLLDPARTAKSRTSQTAVGVVGIDTKPSDLGSRCIVRDIICEHLDQHEIIDSTLNKAQAYNARVIVVDITGLHEHITYPLRNEMIRRGRYFEILEVTLTERDKVDRIFSALLPLYRAGLIHHNKAVCAVLEGQLLSMPRGKFKDAADMLSLLPIALDKGCRYFPLLGKEEFDSPNSDEFADLELDTLPKQRYGKAAKELTWLQ